MVHNILSLFSISYYYDTQTQRSTKINKLSYLHSQKTCGLMLILSDVYISLVSI